MRPITALNTELIKVRAMYALAALATVLVVLLPRITFAAETGVQFEDAYNFIFDAATGYLGRAIAIAGGLIGLGFGAATGRPIVAVVGIVLAFFGALGPAIINAIFNGALI